MSVRFVHTADLHLGSPFKGIDRASPQIAAELRSSTFRTFDSIIRLSIDEHVDAVLISGDIFDSADRSLTAQTAFRRGLQELHDAGIASFICHGNHDPLDGWEANLSFPPSCHRFGPSVEEVPLSPSLSDIVVVGVSYPTRDVRANLALSFTRSPSARFAIGMLHCNVNSDPNHGPYATCSLEDLGASKIDYWALGHIHNRKILNDRAPVVAYPGTPQGRNPREGGARGVFLVTIDDDLNADVQFRPTDTVRWESIELQLDSISSEEDLLNLVKRTARQCLQSSDGRSVVYSLTLLGTTPLHQTLERPGFTTDMIDQINEELCSVKPWAWCGRLAVNTKLSFDRVQRIRGNDFVAMLLREVDAIKNDETERTNFGYELRDLYYGERLRKYLSSRIPPDAELLALIDRAEEICVENLSSPDE
jgi:exonuclease SbcD